jgi:hypothetical protein
MHTVKSFFEKSFMPISQIKFLYIKQPNPENKSPQFIFRVEKKTHLIELLKQIILKIKTIN